MKTHQVSALAALAVSATVLIVGCTAGMKSLVSPSAPDQPSNIAAAPGREGPTAPRPVPEGRSGPRPEYAPPQPPDQSQQSPTVNLSEKEELAQAGLKFAGNVPGVKHVKTCYSRLTGLWYLFLYVPKGKRISIQQWAWNTRTKEWEMIPSDRSKGDEIEADKLEYHLKSELPDEKCFPLK